MSELWSCTIRERTPITGWRDGNEQIRKDVFEAIRWLAYKKVVPDKDIGKSLPKLAKNQDVVIATFAAKPKAKIKWTDVEKLTNPNGRAQTRWFQQEVLAELGRGAKPAPLASVRLAIHQVHPDAGMPRDHESRFLLRMLVERSASLRKLFPRWTELDFDPDATTAPELYFKYDLERTKNAKVGGRAPLVATAEVIAPKAHLDELPDEFESTAF